MPCIGGTATPPHLWIAITYRPKDSRFNDKVKYSPLGINKFKGSQCKNNNKNSRDYSNLVMMI